MSGEGNGPDSGERTTEKHRRGRSLSKAGHIPLHPVPETDSVPISEQTSSVRRTLAGRPLLRLYQPTPAKFTHPMTPYSHSPIQPRGVSLCCPGAPGKPVSITALCPGESLTLCVCVSRANMINVSICLLSCVLCPVPALCCAALCVPVCALCTGHNKVPTMPVCIVGTYIGLCS